MARRLAFDGEYHDWLNANAFPDNFETREMFLRDKEIVDNVFLEYGLESTEVIVPLMDNIIQAQIPLLDFAIFEDILPPGPEAICVTHSGVFHADEMFAFALLRMNHKGMRLVRTREKAILESNDERIIFVDVGGEYDKTKRFDHHQLSFSQKFDEFSVTPMSSAGLIWGHFGTSMLRSLYEFFVRKVVPASEWDYFFNNKEKLLPYVFVKFYHNFVEEIDAHDNGVDVSTFPLGTSYSRCVARYNGLRMDLGVRKAVSHASEIIASGLKEIFSTGIIAAAKLDLFMARDIMYPSEVTAKGFLDIRQIPSHDGTFLQWRGCLHQLERAHGIAGKYKYIVYREGVNTIAVTACTHEFSFTPRVLFPEKYTHGGFEKIIFAHKNRFYIKFAGDVTIDEIMGMVIDQ